MKTITEVLSMLAALPKNLDADDDDALAELRRAARQVEKAAAALADVVVQMQAARSARLAGSVFAAQTAERAAERLMARLPDEWRW